MILCCNTCNKQLKYYKLWLLQDIKGFTDRAMFIVKCSKCRTLTVALKETRISDNKIFINKIPNELLALKTIARESKRIIREHISSDSSTLKGWIYGTNTELKNKNGEVIQIRQYSTDFNQNKHLIKKIMVNK